MTRAKKPIAPKISEAELQKTVIRCARLHGWKVAHFRPALMRSGRWATPVEADGKGFPDLVLAKPGRVAFPELKSDKGKPTKEQLEWLYILGGFLWRPADWLDGSIDAFLAGKVGPKESWFLPGQRIVTSWVPGMLTADPRRGL